MSMTREEAIKFAEHAVNMTDIPEVKEFYRLCAAALRPVRREQVERMRGEWRPHMTNEEAISVIENEIQIDVRLCTDEQVDRFQTALYMAISALRAEPTGDSLTLEQLRELDGHPVWIVESPDWGHWELSEDAEDYLCDRDTDLYGLTYPDPDGKAGLHKLGWVAYAYPPAHIDREAWTAEWKDHYKSGVHAGTGAICSSCDVWNERKTHICPFCGKAMDEDGFAMLEKRMGVRV